MFPRKHHSRFFHTPFKRSLLRTDNFSLLNTALSPIFPYFLLKNFASNRQFQSLQYWSLSSFSIHWHDTFHSILVGTWSATIRPYFEKTLEIWFPLAVPYINSWSLKRPSSSSTMGSLISGASSSRNTFYWLPLIVINFLVFIKAYSCCYSIVTYEFAELVPVLNTKFEMELLKAAPLQTLKDQFIQSSGSKPGTGLQPSLHPCLPCCTIVNAMFKIEEHCWSCQPHASPYSSPPTRNVVLKTRV